MAVHGLNEALYFVPISVLAASFVLCDAAVNTEGIRFFSKCQTIVTKFKKEHAGKS
jgi:hypothetical protein